MTTNQKRALTLTNFKETILFLWFVFSAPYILLYKILCGKKTRPEDSDVSSDLDEALLILAAAASGLFHLAVLVVVLFGLWITR
jgi:hypothetical protein